jgi:3-deoxy-D-manno-octulosonic-acid transferase
VSIRRLAYSILIYCFVTFALLRLWFRSRSNADLRQYWLERFGYQLPFKKRSVKTKPVICIHAVSVGETLGAKALIQAIIDTYPQHQVLMTSTTLTGRNTVRQLFTKQVKQCYFPYDLVGSVQRFLRIVRPEKVIIIETEIWPNFYAACKQRDIPIILANARLSQRSMRAYLKVQRLSAETLHCIALIAARGQQDAEHFIQIGADAARTLVTGNIKFDLPLPEEQIQQTSVLQQQWGQQRPVWVAASTHQGEDEILLTIHKNLIKHFPNLLFILVPRHPERFNTVYQLAQKTALSVQRRSSDSHFLTSTQIILADSMGEMFTWYAAADIVFMGGSLVNVGGHNPLEPAALARPIISGQYIFNFPEVFPLLQTEQAAWVLNTSSEIEQQILHLLHAPDKAKQAGQAGKKVVQAHQGAVSNVLDKIAEMG